MLAMGTKPILSRTIIAFKRWTDADGILDYLRIRARLHRQVRRALRTEEVERVLDAAHALQTTVLSVPAQGMPPICARKQKREEERRQHGEQLFNDLWRTVPQGKPIKMKTRGRRCSGCRKRTHFLEKTRRACAGWQRDSAHRSVDQSVLLSSGKLTVMNEGLRHVHHRIIEPAAEKGRSTTARSGSLSIRTPAFSSARSMIAA